jgi:hypothetical protein
MKFVAKGMTMKNVCLYLNIGILVGQIPTETLCSSRNIVGSGNFSPGSYVLSLQAW